MAARGGAALGLACLAACLVPSGVVLAHAPVVQDALFAPTGTMRVVDLPGFGLLIGDDAHEAYACDDLLRVTSSEVLRPVLFNADGTLLVGTTSGLRKLDSAGCPIPKGPQPLDGVPVLALARAPSGRIYAVTGGVAPVVFAGDMAGENWERLDSLPLQVAPTGLVVSMREPERVLVSFDTSDTSTTLRVIDPIAISAVSVDMPRGFTILQGPLADDPSLWAVQRSADAIVNRGFELVRAASLDAAWQSVQILSYFGGFAREPDGTLWLADEGVGVYRSDDDGATFTTVSTSIHAGCLVAAQGTVWACQLSLPTQPGLWRLNETTGEFEADLTLSDVSDLVACPSSTDVESICAAAHIEWRRDVQMLPMTLDDAGVDAGTPPDSGELDAGQPPAPSEDDAQVRGADDAATPPVRPTARVGDGGCSTSTTGGGPARAPLAYAFFSIVVLAARRARQRQRMFYRPEASARPIRRSPSVWDRS